MGNDILIKNDIIMLIMTTMMKILIFIMTIVIKDLIIAKKWHNNGKF